MDFLAPMFLAGAAAVALPILFHLIRKTTKEKTVFSSLMFLFPTPPKVTRRSRLDNILLLLLRCGVLCLLALGFARPYLVRPSEATAASGPGKRMVVLIDTSASMRRENLWVQARERAGDLLQRVGPADDVAIFAFNDRSTEIVGLEEWRRAQVQERRAMAAARLEALSPTWRGTHLGSALLTGVEALEDAQKRELPPEREIVVVTDLQQGSRLDGLQGFEWPKGVSVRVERLKVKRLSNAGIHLLEDQGDAGLAAELNHRMRVVNSSDSRKEQFKIAWIGGTNPPIETYVPPGQSRILQLPSGESSEGELLLNGDDDDFDNRLYWVATRQSQLQIPYVGSEAESDTAQPLFYLKRAFQQTARQDVRITNQMVANARLTIVSGRAEAGLGSEATARPTGTVLVVLKSCESASIVSSLLNLPQLSCEEAREQRFSLLGEIDFTHPVFRPFAEPRFSDFTKIHFWKHRRLDAQQIPNARVLARFDNGDPALIEAPFGNRKLLILTSAWHPADSQLALSSKFVPLLYSLLEYSSIDGSAGTLRPTLFQVGQILPEELGAPRETPGIYTAGKLRFAVNLAPAESRTAPMPIDELEQLGVPIAVSAVSRDAATARKAQKFQAAETENQQKLWRWLILGALGFLVIETFLAGRLSRKA